MNWIRNLLGNSLMVKLINNASILLSGQILVSLFSIITMVITARALGSELFGILVLVQTYVLIIDGLMNFQSWQTLVKFGTDAIEKKEKGVFSALVKFVLLIDVLTAILATILALILLNFIDGIISMEPDKKIYFIIYSVSIGFHISGMPIAVLRMFDKFKLFAIQSVAVAFIKMIGVMILYFINAGLFSFVIVWVITDIIGHLILLFFGMQELKHRGYSFVDGKLINIKGLLRKLLEFIFTTNLSSSIRMTTKQLDIIVVGSLLGNSAVGIYKIAKQFSVILSKMVDPLYQVIYPQFSKLVASKDIASFKHLLFRSSFLAGIIAIFTWILFLLFGEYLILLTVGEEFLSGKGVLLWYMLAIVISVISFALQPSMLALGYPKHSLGIHFISTVIYFICLPLFLVKYGLIGAGISYVIYYLVWAMIMLFFVKQNINNFTEENIIYNKGING